MISQLICFVVGAYLGWNGTKAWEQWKLGTAYLRDYYRKKREEQK